MKPTLRTAFLGLVFFGLLTVLFAPQAVAAVTGTVSRWVNNMLVFDGSSGNNAFAFDVDGLRGDFGTGVNDYMASNGTSIVCGATLDSTCVAPATTFYVDGGSLLLASAYAHPGTPSSGIEVVYGFSFDSGFPQITLQKESYFALPAPIGIFNGFTAYGAESMWEVSCCQPAGYGNTGTTCTNLAAGGAVSNAGNVTGPAWAVTSLYTRSRVLLATATSTAANLNAGTIMSTGLQGAWRGDGAGKGGFLYWTRVAINTAGANQKAFYGLVNRTTILTATAEPSSFADTVYIGADSAAANLSICSNDNSGSATCNTLGASFPSTTSGAIYDIWFSAAPGSSSIEWYIYRIDSAATASGSLTTDLPRNSVQFNWQSLLNTGAAGGVAVANGWLGECLAYNY